MKLIPQITSEIKTLLLQGEEITQKAKITIKFVNNEGLKRTGSWEFVDCKFQPTHIPYTLEDWEFLAAINEKIKELIN